MNPVTPYSRRQNFSRENSSRTVTSSRPKEPDLRGSSGVSVLCVNRTTTSIPMATLRKRTLEIIAILKRLGRWKRKRYALSLIFVSNRESRTLNARFRREDTPANVLSFDYGSSGELVLAPKLIGHEARAFGQSFFARLLRLVMHGLLHLAGSHHERSRKQVKTFERLERAVLKQLEL